MRRFGTMISFFLQAALCLEFKGKWVGNMTSRSENISATMRFRFVNGKLQAVIDSAKQTPMLPHRVNVRVLKENQSYVLLIPSKQLPKFVTLELNQTVLETYHSEAVTEDGVWDVVLDLVPSKEISFRMKKKGKSAFFNYTFEKAKPQRMQFAIGFGVALAAIVIYIAYSLIKPCFAKNKAD